MGTSESKEQILPELDGMNIIKQEENYTIYEKGTLQQELWLISTTKTNCKDDEALIKQIKEKQYQGFANIINYKLVENNKWYSISADKYFCILIEHPKYNLREYFSKKQASFEYQQIVDLLVQVLGSQLVLGKHSQYLGFENIFTSDGNRWMIKPFLPNQSFYPYYQKTHNASNGFPAPEEFDSKVSDTNRVQIFGFGMILLELILRKQSADIYSNGKINLKLLEERTKELQSYKKIYSENLINLISDVIEPDLTKRPNYSKLSQNFQNSKINTEFYDELFKVPIIQGKISFNQPDSIINMQNIVRIQEVQSKIEGSILESKKIQEKKINNCSNQLIQQLDGTYYKGDIKNNQYHGSGILYSKDGEKLYEGEFAEGKYHGFGIEYFTQNNVSDKNLDYKDLTQMFQFAVSFEGTFQVGKKIGEGKAILFNGESFSGIFYNDLPNGIGAFINRNNQKYSALWKNGILDTFYCMTNSTKNFQSNYSEKQNNVQLQNNSSSNFDLRPPSFNDQYQGNPILMSANFQMTLQELNVFGIKDSLDLYKTKQKTENVDEEGKRVVCYEGEFLGNKLNGKGIQYSKNNFELYNGGFSSGKYHNYGKLINENPNNQCPIDIKDFRKLLQDNGWKSYQGQFLNGQKNGVGQLILVDLSLFQGTFFKDQVHGEGVLQRINKEEIVAIWRDGQLERILKGNI